MDLNEILKQLAGKSTMMIASPETIAQMKAKGVQGFKEKFITNEEYIENIFSKRKQTALKKVDDLPKFPEINNPTLSALYDEVVECYIFEVYGGAITLASILLELSLKRFIEEVDTQSEGEKLTWDKLEIMDFGTLIKTIEDLKMLDKTDIENLRQFKNRVRNNYAHYKIKTLIADVVIRNVKILNVVTNETMEQDMNAIDHKPFWFIGKKFVDKEEALPVINFVINFISKIFPTS